MQKLDAACLSDFRTVQSIRQEKLIVWETHCKQFRWACKLGGIESHGIPKVGQTWLARLMDTLIWCPPVSSVEKSSAKKQWPLLALLLEESCPSSLCLESRKSSFPPYIPGAF